MYLKLMRGQMKVVEFKKEEKPTADFVLEDAKDLLSEVVIIGIDKTNRDLLFMSSNIQSKAEMVYLIEQLKLQLLNNSFDSYEED